MFISVTENSYFFYSIDLELLFAANSILQGEPVHKFCSETYGEDRILELKKKYHFLFEVFEAHKKYAAAGILEPLLWLEQRGKLFSSAIKDSEADGFSLKQYQECIEKLDTAEFLKLYFCLEEMTVEEVKAAIEQEDKLEALYMSDNPLTENFLGMQSMFLHTSRFVREYFALAEELRTPAFEKIIEEQRGKIHRALQDAREQLVVLEPLEYSQKLMGKNFYNRGPYGKFYFSVSLFMPYRSVRFFGENQILFQSLRQVGMDDEELLQKLKVIADDTRFKIIVLLGEKKNLRGMDIAQLLKLAPSTVSHHMEQLSKAGIVHEEPVKNSKYYSLNQIAVNGMLERLGEILKK